MRLNKILMWYGKDFERFAGEDGAAAALAGGDGERTKAEAGVLEFVCRNLEDELEAGEDDGGDDRAPLLRVWLDKRVPFRVEYRDYNWGSNSK